MSNQQSNVCDPIYSELAQSDADFAEIVELFVDGLVDRLRGMEQALDENDLDRLRRLFHQLKGSGGGHGYPLLTSKAADLEQLAINSQVEQIKAGLEELTQLMGRVKVLPAS